MARSIGRYSHVGRLNRLYRGARSTPPVSWRRDVINGALLGDFALELGLPGALAQVVLSFIPLVGTVGAVRDTIADWRQRDRIDVLLNILVLIPFLGGFAKVVEVARNLRRVGRAVRVVRGRGRPDYALSTARRAA